MKHIFQEELGLFKDIIRQVTKHDLEPIQAEMFQAEERTWLRRLALLAVNGHQPAINGFIQMSAEEKEKIADCIMQQKSEANEKGLKEYRDLVRRRKQEMQNDQEGGEGQRAEVIRIRRAKLAMQAPVKWKRSTQQWLSGK